MGKPQKNASIRQEDNLKILLNDTQICKVIVDIKYSDLQDISKKNILLEKFRNNYKRDNNSEKLQYGRVWFLVKNCAEYFDVLQVAEAIDYGINFEKGFFNEIYRHIKEMFESNNSMYSSFAKELKSNETLSFYEVNIEAYLEKYAPLNYKEIIYKMASGYFAEASLAYFTQAREWRFYNSGMDKRSYYYITENIKAINIDKQND